MQKAMKEQIKRQTDKLTVWLMKYYPVRIKNVGERQIADRQTIWDFKDGRAYEEVAQMTAKQLQELFGSRLVEKPRDFDPFGQTGFAHLWLQYD